MRRGPVATTPAYSDEAFPPLLRFRERVTAEAETVRVGASDTASAPVLGVVGVSVTATFRMCRAQLGVVRAECRRRFGLVIGDVLRRVFDDVGEAFPSRTRLLGRKQLAGDVAPGFDDPATT